MPTSRSYRDSCGIARALDVVGERWALLVVRELLLVPQRFSDLRRALPNASTNLLSDRLRELEHNGVITRRPPYYELTDRGRKLEPIVLALGEWGIEFPPPPLPASLSETSMMIYLRGAGRPDPDDPPMVCRLDLGGRPWTIRTVAGRIDVQAEEPTTADVSLRTDPRTLNDLLTDPDDLDAALADGRATAVGDLPALRRLLSVV